VTSPSPRESGTPLRRLETADADFVTAQLLVGGDLDTQDLALAAAQLAELLDAGVTHVVDTRVEWTDEEWAAQVAPRLGYLHHGMDDAGQQVPDEWFDAGVEWVLQAVDAGGTVLTHCHMGINRGPSLGFAVLLAQGWDPIEALDQIRAVRPIAWIAYAADALRWHHGRQGSARDLFDGDLERLNRWRRENELDLAEVIRLKREQGW